MVLKLEKIFRVLHRGFGRREITWCSNRISSMCRWISSLKGWITWYSNAQKYTGNNEFGLEEGKITWYSNLLLRCKDKEIAGHSNIYWLIVTAAKGLAEDKITWFSNFFIVIPALKKGKIAWFSNCGANTYRVWRGVKLHGSQTQMSQA